MAQYTVLVFPEDGSFSVLVPTLDNLATQGRTIDEALDMAREAIELYLEGLTARGEYIPTEEQPPIVATLAVTAPVPTAP